MPPSCPARERSALRPISAAGSEGDGTPRSAAPISAGGLPGHLREAARPDRVCAGLLPGRGAGAVASGEAVVSREHFVVPALDVVPVCFLGYCARSRWIMAAWSGSRRDSCVRASACRPHWKPQNRPGPTDAKGADLHLGPDCCLPGRLGDLPAGPASTGRNRLPDAGATHSLAQGGALYVTASYHVKTNCANHASESGVQAQYAAPDRRSDHIALLGSDASPVSHRPHVPLIDV
jgi:hypothetical protein